MEMTIDIDVAAITKEVKEDLDMPELARSVLDEFQYDERFGELVAEHTEEGLVESLVKALTSLRDSNKERAEANRELRKEIRALKEGKSDD